MPFIDFNRATYRRHHASGKWEVCYYIVHADRRQRKWKGGFSVRRDAETWLHDLNKQLSAVPTATVTTLADYVTQYLDSCHHKQKSSIEQDRIVLKAFLSSLPAGIMLHDVTTAHINKHLATRLKSLSRHTVSRDLRTLKTFFNTAVRTNALAVSPANPIPGIIPDESEIRYLTLPEQSRLIAAARDIAHAPYLYPLITLALRTGMRRGELLHLRWTDIQPTRIHVTTTDEHRTKSGRSRTVPVDTYAADAIQWWRGYYAREIKHCEQKMQSTHRQTRDKAEYRRDLLLAASESEWVFPSANPRKPMQQFGKTWDQARKAAKVDVRFHDLRHTFAVMCAFSGVPIALLSQLLGHSDIKTTQIYLRFYQDDAAARVVLPELP